MLNLNKFLTPGKAGVVIAFFTKSSGTIIGMILNIVLARSLGASGIGVYFLSISLINMASIVARLGLDITSLRYASIAFSNDDLPTIAGLNRTSTRIIFSVGIAVMAILYVLVPVLPLAGSNNEEFVKTLRIMIIAIIPFSLIRIQGQLFKAIKLPGKGTFVQAALLPLVMTISVTVIALQQSITSQHVAYLYVFASVLTLIISAYMLSKSIPRIWFIDGNFDYRTLINSSIPVFWLAGMNAIMNWSDTLILGIWWEPDVVGLYGIALRLAGLIGFILVAVNSVISPKFAAAYTNGNHSHLEKLAQNSTKLMTLFTLPILIIIWSFPEQLLSVFGHHFTHSEQPLKILSIGQFINVAFGAIGALLLMTGNERVIRNNAIFAIISNIVGNLLLVPRYGAVGAAASTSISLVLQNILLYRAVKHILKIRMIKF